MVTNVVGKGSSMKISMRGIRKVDPNLRMKANDVYHRAIGMFEVFSLRCGSFGMNKLKVIDLTIKISEDAKAVEFNAILNMAELDLDSPSLARRTTKDICDEISDDILGTAAGNLVGFLGKQPYREIHLSVDVKPEAKQVNLGGMITL
jgi:hypothetical protein